MNVPVPEDTPEIRKSQRWQRVLVFSAVLGSLATLAIVIGLLVFEIFDIGGQADARDAAARTLAISERNDCRSAYNSERNSVIERAEALERQSVIDVGGYLLGNPTASSEVLIANRAKLVVANVEVLALPTLNHMVENGYTLNNVKHPPCPEVK